MNARELEKIKEELEKISESMDSKNPYDAIYQKQINKITDKMQVDIGEFYSKFYKKLRS